MCPITTKENNLQAPNERIERYIYEVVKWLPLSSREEVSKELTSHIWDNLEALVGDESPTLDDVDKALLALGDPLILSKQYGKPVPHLIHPLLLDTYYLVLKIALLGSFIGLTIAQLFDVTAVATQGKWLQLVIQYIASILQVGLSTFGSVTLIFIMIDRTSTLSSQEQGLLNKKDKNAAWHPNQLGAVPKPMHSIKRSNALSDVITTGAGLLMINVFLPKFTYIQLNGQGAESFKVPMLSLDALTPYLWALNILLSLQLILYIYNLIQARWFKGTRIVDSLLHVAFVLVFAVALTDSHLILPNAFNALNAYKPEWAEPLFKGLSTGLTLAFILITLLALVQIAEHVYKGFLKKE